MTFKKVLFLVILSVLCISVSAQFASFRSLSTAGLIDDDIEAMLAVTEMTYVEGFNIFTNLSNFNYQSEEIFNNYSENYLIGFKGAMMDMLHVGFLSSSDGYSIGDTLTAISTTYADNNNDEQYDEFASEVEDWRDFSSSNDSKNFFALAFGKKEGIKAGFSYFNQRGASDYKQNYTDAQRDSNMISGDLIGLYKYWYDYSDGNSYTNNYFSLNGAMATGSFEAALSLDFGFLKYDYNYLEGDSSYNDLNPSSNVITIEEYYRWQDKENYTQTGFNWNVGIKTYYRINEDSLEIGGNFSNTNFAKTPYFYDEVYYESYIYPGIVDDELYSYRDTASLSDSNSTVSENYTSWNLGAKFVKSLEKAFFAMGIGVGQSKNFYIDTMNFDYRVDESYDNGDGIQDGTDFTYVETGTYSAEFTYNELSTHLYLPVGLEYNFWGPLVGRLGANTTLYWGSGYESERYLSYDPGTGTYTYGDGSVYEYLNETYSSRNDYEAQINYFDRYTDFSYGIGWQISKNVKIDLMGYSDLTSLTDWRISANVKF